MKMWIAYLLPTHDYRLALEDGIGYMAKGNTEEEAKANLRVCVRTNAMIGVELSDEEMTDLYDDCVLHTQEV